MSSKTKALSALIHAPAKVGKTTFSSTSPTPMLVLDAEGGWRFIKTKGWRGQPLRKVYWNPLLNEPPKNDGTWDICIVTVDSWQVVTQTYQWLNSGKCEFRTLIVDSISEIQRRLKTNLVGTEQMKIQDWGSLLTQMDMIIRSMRDLKDQPGPLECVIFIAETRKTDGIFTPYMQGQIAVSLPYWMDIVGYLFVQPELDPTDPNGQATMMVRNLMIGAHPQYVTGERVQGALPDVIRDPNITEMFKAIFGEDSLEEAK